MNERQLRPRGRLGLDERDVGTLRKTLGDTGPEPTYVATIPRKGYTLVAKVERLPPRGRNEASEAAAPVAAEAGADAADQSASSPAATTAAPTRLRLLRRWPVAAGVILLAVAISLAAPRVWRTFWPGTPPAPAIAVLPFADLTSDQASRPFCDGLTEELIADGRVTALHWVLNPEKLD